MVIIIGDKPSDPVRQFFLTLDGSKSKYVIYNKQVSNRIEHLKAHRTQCSNQSTDTTMVRYVFSMTLTMLMRLATAI